LPCAVALVCIMQGAMAQRRRRCYDDCAGTRRRQHRSSIPFAVAQSAMTQLDQLRVLEANNPQRRLDLLKQGLKRWRR
jgi:hypothetical protein